MKIAVLFSPWLLAFRKTMELADVRNDPRGLTGSELGFLRISEELAKLGHDVHIYTITEDRFWNGCTVHPWPNPERFGGANLKGYDVVISINCPDELRGCDGYRVCMFWLNDVSFCHVGFEQHVDLWCSCSEPHLRQMLTNEDWRKVEVLWDHPDGLERYEPDPSKWCVVPLGCDPERYPNDKKVFGRIVYCSSPDRGLHHLLGAWPQIKRAIPDASLKIFYRLRAWMEGFDDIPYSPAIEPLRARALYIEECLRRMQDPRWGIQVCDSVSHAQIEHEMSIADILAFPCDTIRWSEGFSCTTLEGCAARACPIVLDCDALGEIYKDAGIIVPNLTIWKAAVVECLRDDRVREIRNAKARAFAEKLTWANTAAGVLEAIRQHQKAAA